MPVMNSDMHAHIYEQFLKTSDDLGLGLVFVCLFRFGILCVLLVQLGLSCSRAVCFCCVKISFHSIMARAWLGKTSPKRPILCRVDVKP